MLYRIHGMVLHIFNGSIQYIHIAVQIGDIDYICAIRLFQPQIARSLHSSHSYSYTLNSFHVLACAAFQVSDFSEFHQV
ncbi:hypothetical protein D3C75_1122680 [compost metagenome]